MLTSIYGNNGFKAGGPSISIRNHVDIAIDSLIENGAELIVPGMTEIPIVMRDGFKEFSVPILPVNEIYARFGLTQTSHNILKPFKVGVVGGVGPAATVDFLAKLVDATGASKDQDHIKVLVEQNPQIPDRTSNLIGEGADPTLALYSTARKLMNGGADIIAIPCNTAHAYVETIQKYLDIPIINMLTETADHIRRLSPMPQRVGILATSGTIACNIYQDALNAAGLRPIVPSAADQAKVMDAIYGAKGVKAGFKEGLCSVQILEAINALLDRGADAIILGCTELPLIKLPEHISQQARLFDPTMILAKKCVAISRSTM
jgi:aspartate racemase